MSRLSCLFIFCCLGFQFKFQSNSTTGSQEGGVTQGEGAYKGAGGEGVASGFGPHIVWLLATKFD